MIHVSRGDSRGLVPLTPEQAIELATRLLEAGAEIDGWLDDDRNTEDDDTVPDPVDSAIRKCCGGLGMNTRDC